MAKRGADVSVVPDGQPPAAAPATPPVPAAQPGQASQPEQPAQPARRARVERHESPVATVMDAIRNAPIAIIGSLLVVAGAVLQVVALVSVSWWHVTLTDPDRSVTFGFSEFGDRTQQGLAYIYFSWGAWVMLAVSVVLGVAACVRWRGARPFRFAGAIFGVLGAGVTIGALLTFAYQADESIFQVARNYTSGVYLAMLGLLATAFGAAAGGAGR